MEFVSQQLFKYFPNLLNVFELPIMQISGSVWALILVLIFLGSVIAQCYIYYEEGLGSALRYFLTLLGVFCLVCIVSWPLALLFTLDPGNNYDASYLWHRMNLTLFLDMLLGAFVFYRYGKIRTAYKDVWQVWALHAFFGLLLSVYIVPASVFALLIYRAIHIKENFMVAARGAFP